MIQMHIFLVGMAGAGKTSLGRRLAQTAIDFAGERGYAEMYLDCMSSSVNAVALYERLGFHKTAKYNKNNFADIFMKKAL